MGKKEEWEKCDKPIYFTVHVIRRLAYFIAKMIFLFDFSLKPWNEH
jgi:hypothetical protein